MTYRKKLIEVALPLEAINEASIREKSIRHGHPSTLHIWWARRPLAAARAVIFSQMVDDPSEYTDELIADSVTRRESEKYFRIQLKTWEDRKSIFDKAHAAGMNTNANPDPGLPPTIEEAAAELERGRLFRIIEDLVLWENTANEKLLQIARNEIWRSWQRTCLQNVNHSRAKELFDPETLPMFHDPFAGGGALPLEAQRLGLKAYASDLNPIAVVINKAMIEIPSRFAGQPPVNPEVHKQPQLVAQTWRGAQGLAEDVLYYGKWMRNEAEKRIGYLYPKAEITQEMVKERPDLKSLVGSKLTIIAWLWARTVKSPNPAFSDVYVPLVSTFLLSPYSDKGAYVEPVIENSSYHFLVKFGKTTRLEATKNGTKLARGANFSCLMSGIAISGDYIKAEAQAGRMKSRLMAIVAEGDHGRVYLSPSEMMEKIAREANPVWEPDIELVGKCRDQLPLYGIKTFADIYTSRQLVALTTFSDLVHEVHKQIKSDAISAGFFDDNKSLDTGGSSATAYADAVSVYLSFGVDKMSDRHSTLGRWDPTPTASGIINTFSRQALQMSWDYAEGNPFSNASANFEGGIGWIVKVINESLPAIQEGNASAADASIQNISAGKVISTDPPYYDNICYADLSDYFYVWLRHSLRPVFPDLFSTLTVPKSEELIASPYRHDNKEEAEKFFLDGMTKAMKRLSDSAHPVFPVTIYYAFKQSENDDEGIASTGWDTFLEAVIRAGFTISGTWPMRTELANRMIGSGTNSLASSIVLVCRKSIDNSFNGSRAEFINALKSELPNAIAQMQKSNIAPVDLAQAAIGPGIAVFTRYKKVLDAQGKPLSVRQALALINQTLDEVLAKQEGDFDADTRFALAWFEQFGFTEGEFGVADVLARAKDTSVNGMVDAGIIASGRGKVRLLTSVELPEDWNPQKDQRLTTWEMVHQLIRIIEKDGEEGAATLLGKLGVKAEAARELCYRLYTIAERKRRTTEALAYNGLVQSWPEITRLAREYYQPDEIQTTLF